MSERDPDDDEPAFDSVSDTASLRQRRRTRRARRSLRVPVDEVPRRSTKEIEAVEPSVAPVAPPSAAVSAAEADVDVPIELTPTGVPLPPVAHGAQPLPEYDDELVSVPTIVQAAPEPPRTPAPPPAAADDDPDADPDRPVVVVRRAVMVRGSEMPPPPSVIEVPPDLTPLRDLAGGDTDPHISIAALEEALDVDVADEQLRGDLDPTDRAHVPATKPGAAVDQAERSESMTVEAIDEKDLGLDDDDDDAAAGGEVAEALAEVDALPRRRKETPDTIDSDALVDEAADAADAAADAAGQPRAIRVPPPAPPPPPSASGTAAGPAVAAPPPPPPTGVAPAPPSPPAAAAAAAAPSLNQAPSAAAETPPDQRSRRKRPRIWFEDFFNDDYLRTVRPPKDPQVQRQCDFVEQSLGLAPGGTILDVGCGLGLQAIELACRGYAVVGLDLSLPMLSRAGDEAQDRGLKMNFLHGDMRDMSFDGSFDSVLCLGTTYGYFDDETNKQVLSRMYRALKPMGLLMLDVVNRDFVVRNQPNLVWFEGDGCVCMEETFFNYITSRLHVKRTVILEDGRQRENEYTIRLYSLHELGQVLHHMGFRVAEVSGREATPGVFFGADSPRMIILAERRASVGDDERTPGPITASNIALTAAQGAPPQATPNPPSGGAPAAAAPATAAAPAPAPATNDDKKE